jgi:hypothetical protein
MRTAEATLKAVGLQIFWEEPARMRAESSSSWRRQSYAAVDTKSNADREVRMRALRSTATYTDIKDWGACPREYAFSSGEEDKIGQHVSERYLDDREDLKGTRLKLLCRTGCLPIMRRVGREMRPPWPKATRTCITCNGQVEDVEHFVMKCPSYMVPRRIMMTDARKALDRSSAPLTAASFDAMSDSEQCKVLLGKRIGDPFAENRLDRSVKRFLRKAWTTRAPVTARINAVLNTHYEVFVWKR